jgi:hypothetical protein
MGAKKRRPFRFLFKLAVFAGILSAAGRFLVSKKEEYSGLTESEARERMQAKLTPRFGEEKAKEITDQVVPVLADRGILRSESSDQPTTSEQPSGIDADGED